MFHKWGKEVTNRAFVGKDLKTATLNIETLITSDPTSYMHLLVSSYLSISKECPKLWDQFG